MRASACSATRSPSGEHSSGSTVARVRRLVGPHHQLSVKYVPAYLDERRWRSDNRGNPRAFQDTLQALLEGEGISYERLVAAA